LISNTIYTGALGRHYKVDTNAALIQFCKEECPTFPSSSEEIHTFSQLPISIPQANFEEIVLKAKGLTKMYCFLGSHRRRVRIYPKESTICCVFGEKQDVECIDWASILLIIQRSEGFIYYRHFYRLAVDQR
jgi:hypothetical protein